MKAALIGPLQSGKSTVVSAISGKEGPAAGGTHIEEAIANVPDERVEWLYDLYKPKKKVYATLDCLDVPGFSFSDEHGRANARRLINQLRTAELLVVVVRAFDSAGKEREPSGDIVELKTELLLSDLELVTTRIERLEKQLHKPGKTQGHDKAELELQLKLQEAIETEKPIRSVVQSEAEIDLIKSLGFMTLKPFIVVVNVSEGNIGREYDLSAAAGDAATVSLCAKFEAELRQLDEVSRAEFMADLGIESLAVNRFVKSCYDALGLISFLTVSSDEVRAWAIPRGTTAHDAAGKVHSDMKRGFIRAETMSFDDLREFGDEKAVKAAGRTRLEGKEYVVQDGDVIYFRFNV
ncbi:MAG: DUF933 domain-containing protein [Planctomycetota bacterium]